MLDLASTTDTLSDATLICGLLIWISLLLVKCVNQCIMEPLLTWPLVQAFKGLTKVKCSCATRNKNESNILMQFAHNKGKMGTTVMLINILNPIFNSCL